MKLNKFLLVCASLLFSSVSQAQSVSYIASDLAYAGSAKADNSTGQVILSEDGLYNQYGEAWLPGEVCAKEFTMEFEVFLGNKTASQGGGAGLGYQINSARDSKYLNRVNFNIQDRARIANFNSVEVFKYYGTETYPANGNIFQSLNISKPAFNLSDGVWRKVIVKVDEIAFSVIVKDPLAGSVVVASSARTYKAGSPFKQFFYGWTGSAKNKFAIRSIKSTIIKSDNCSGLDSLGIEEAKQRIVSTCGLDSCDGYPAFFSCAAGILGNLKQTGEIESAIEESILSDYQNKLNYCSGSLECKSDLDSLLASEHQKGFQSGVGSIDQDAIRKEGFDSGVASIDQEAIRMEAFEAGVASVPVDTIRSEAYSQGFDAGKASIQCLVDGGGSDKEGNNKVTICHKTSSSKSNTIEVNKNSLQAHLKHGDTEGACPILDNSKPAKSKTKK